MGLAGMPGDLSRLMRELFDRFDFVVVYLDDICIFSKTNADHTLHYARYFKCFDVKNCILTAISALLERTASNFLATLFHEMG